jgi:outer membrane protein OmpA-like peptidoglycan-associated protein/opacity protein-like surface antigen
MKKFLIALALLLTAGTGVSRADMAADGWALGFGIIYPRYYSVNIEALTSDYGLYLSIQRNFTEHVGLRLKGGYSHLEGQWTDASLKLITEKTNLITGDLDLVYYITPCDMVSPYLFAGVGGNYKTITGAQSAFPDKDKPGYQLNAGGGAEFKLSPETNLVTEFGYHITDNSVLDGAIVPSELNGYDSYIAFSVGFNYIFGKGEPSVQCGPCQGNYALVDYGRIEDLILKYNTSRKPVVDSYIIKISDDRLLLVGVKFAFDKSNLLPESYVVLDQGVKLLMTRPDVKVEIEGYTDYVGTGAYNQKLSLERAQTVKDYLISKGVAANRLTTIGYGMNNPLEDNKTAEGRAMNRRIVFRILKNN